jgi:hypothetical protein
MSEMEGDNMRFNATGKQEGIHLMIGHHLLTGAPDSTNEWYAI